MNIDNKIEELIELLGGEFKTLKYVYNKNSNFIPGVTPVYYSGPYWDNSEVIAAIKALLVGKWLSAGEDVQKFETKLARKINQKYGLMVNSGSSANLILITALKKYYNWVDNDEIILSVVGFPTTLAPIVQNNLKPIFIDIEMDSLNFNLDLIEAKITTKTKAIFLSPVLGNSPDMDKLLEICERNSIKLILDNCDSLGSKWNGKYLNEYAVASTLSFYPSHHISTGQGGMVISDDKEFIKLCRSFATWSRLCHCSGIANLLPQGSCGNRFDKWLEDYDGIVDHKYVFSTIGYNLQPLDLQGSIGLVQLQKFDEIHSRRTIAKKTMEDILERNIKDIYIPKELSSAETSWFGTPIICKDKALKDRLVEYFESKKVQTRNYFAGNILIQPGYKHLGNFKDYPEANKVLDQVFFIGASPHYNEDIFGYLENICKDFK